MIIIKIFIIIIKIIIIIMIIIIGLYMGAHDGDGNTKTFGYSGSRTK